jgi:membrane-associated phospholipid phosphatase
MRSRMVGWICVGVGLVGFLATYLVLVGTRTGQALDARLSPGRGAVLSNRILGAYDRHVLVCEVVLLGAVIAVSARRHQIRRGLLSAAMPLVVAVEANALQAVLRRPSFVGGSHNSFPSGHVALAAATVLAVLLILPSRARPVVALAGSAAVAVVSVATIAAGWHRFSDGLGAVLLALAAAGAVVIVSPAAEHDGRAASSTFDSESLSIEFRDAA